MASPGFLGVCSGTVRQHGKLQVIWRHQVHPQPPQGTEAGSREDSNIDNDLSGSIFSLCLLLACICHDPGQAEGFGVGQPGISGPAQRHGNSVGPMCASPLLARKPTETAGPGE